MTLGQFYSNPDKTLYRNIFMMQYYSNVVSQCLPDSGICGKNYRSVLAGPGCLTANCIVMLYCWEVVQSICKDSIHKELQFDSQWALLHLYRHHRASLWDCIAIVQ